MDKFEFFAAVVIIKATCLILNTLIKTKKNVFGVYISINFKYS